jgi:hypothetical protein
VRIFLQKELAHLNISGLSYGNYQKIAHQEWQENLK